ncbi:MAG: DNA polymerase III subunit alpha [Actinobacteria bacterium]|nr:MAG: DNA polymerase III subunit alpha [Actinomycetota bacterium]
MSQFVHLHTHSEFSLLDGAARIDDLVAHAKDLGMTSLALTDHGVMYGVVDFYRSAQAAGIKPIVGCEVYVAPSSRFDRVSNREETPYHLVLLAKDNEGYRNLMRIVSAAFVEGFYYKPRVDLELLREHRQGIIGMSACMSGQIAKLVLQSNERGAAEAARRYESIFGEGNFYIELQNQGLAEQAALNTTLARLAEETSLPLVATNDIHYVRREDSAAQDVLLCIQTAATLEQEDRLQFSTNEFYMKSEAEMAQALPGHDEAMRITAEIAERCNVELEFGKILLPHYEPPRDKTLDSYLEELCEAGAAKRYGEITPEVRERLDEELATIEKMGFAGYFLVVWDFIKFAKENGIKVGPGRGSAAGSIVSYCLDITSLDPLEHGLLFERFLNPDRISMPDIDIDFDDEKRDQVIAYVRRKYGEDKVAQIITFGTMKARAATRDAGRVLGYPYGVVDRIAKQITHETIKDSLANNPELRQMYEADEDARKVLEHARALEGLARQDSIHAAGVVISRDSLTDYTPIQQKGDSEVVTQYHMKAIEQIGLLKMDFLGLRTLTVIDNAVKIVKRIHDVDIDIDNLPMDDSKTFELLQRGDTTGLFQLESSGMRNTLKELKPTAFSDIVATVALYRPGPMSMIPDFIARKHGRKKVEYFHDVLEPILAETYGIMVYQEQCMQMSRALAGFTAGQADDLRKAIGKKIAEKMEAIRPKFIEGVVANGHERGFAERMWSYINEFGNYGFNKSHSAAYALVAYQTAYLKAHYPVEFMAALLTSVSGNKDKVVPYVGECEQMGIKVLPPDVNESFRDFTAVGNSIRFGLAAIRNLGESVVESIIRERQARGEFTSIYDFCDRVDSSTVNKRALESMIKAGAFDFTGWPRKHLLAVYETAADAAVSKQRDREAGQTSIFDLGEEEGSPIALEPAVPEPTDAEELPKAELLAYEKDMLGLYVSDHPLHGMEDAIVAQTDFTIARFVEQADGTSGWVGGIITKAKRLTTKKGELMAAIQLEDTTGTVEVVVFPGVYQVCRELIVDDNIVRVKAKLDHKDEETKGLAQEIEPLSAEPQPVKPLNVKVSSVHVAGGVTDRLKEIFTSHPGASSVLLHVSDGNGTQVFQLGEEFKVNPNGLLMDDLRHIVDDSSVWVG